MSEPYVLSNSEIQVFKDCRRKWCLGYYRRLQPKQKQFTGALALGSRIHEALDIHYSTGKDLLEAHAELVKRDIDLLVAEYRDTYDLEAEAELGRIMLEGYQEWMATSRLDALLANLILL